jgi:Na+-transporting methylmalonyl-CoA/oxaloacetate decarboxylase gamma subunit
MTPGASPNARATQRILGAGVAVLLVAAMLVSVIEGTPRALPGVALGSSVLLHAERVLALVGVVIAGLSVLAQATRGRLPVELSTSGLRYEAEAADDAAAAVDQLQDQFDDLAAIVDALAERLDAPQQRP